MKHNFEERRQNRIDYANEQAAKNAEASTAAFNRSSEIADRIPFGQPILVGHHSEKRHRADAARIHNAMDQSVNLSKKSDYYAGKAEAIENNTAIFSDDPNALDKLKEKAKGLEDLQGLMKEANKIIKKHKTQEEQAKALVFELGYSESGARKLTIPDYCGRVGYPSYRLTNNNANIRRIRERIKSLEKVAAMETTEVELPHGVKLVANVEANRLQILFPDKPSEKIREELKGRGFRWAPSEGAWQKHLRPNILNHYTGVLTRVLNEVH